MSELTLNESQFEINVNGNAYTVTAYCKEEHCSKFKIETKCEYLFTLCTDEQGNWQMEQDVTPLNDTLVDQIGRAVEEHDLH